MNELTYQQLCKLAGYTETQANSLGLTRAELINCLTFKLAA